MLNKYHPLGTPYSSIVERIDNSKAGPQPYRNLSTYRDRNKAQDHKTGQVRTEVAAW